MKKAWKIILLVLLFLAVAVGSVFGYRWLSERQTAEAPVSVNDADYLTAASTAGYETDKAMQEKDDLASDSTIDGTTIWPFADRKSDSKFEVKTKTAKKTTETVEDKTTDKEKTSAKKSTTEKASKSSGSVKSFLKKIESSASKTNNGHPVKVDSNGISIEYKKFAVGDLNGDGKDEVFLYAESNKGKDFYGYSYIVYDNSLSNSRITMVIDELKDIKFYKSGVYEITEGKFGFTSDKIAESFGVKNKNSILGYDTTTTPYLRYMTNGPYIDAPSEVSASDYKAAVSKLKAGGEVKVTIYDFTDANVEKL